MKNKALIDEQEQETLKFFAIEEFKDALFKQQFEQCAQLIAAAKQTGSTQDDIDQVIQSYLTTKK